MLGKGLCKTYSFSTFLRLLFLGGGGGGGGMLKEYTCALDKPFYCVSFSSLLLSSPSPRLPVTPRHSWMPPTHTKVHTVIYTHFTSLSSPLQSHFLYSLNLLAQRDTQLTNNTHTKQPLYFAQTAVFVTVCCVSQWMYSAYYIHTSPHLLGLLLGSA